MPVCSLYASFAAANWASGSGTGDSEMESSLESSLEVLSLVDSGNPGERVIGSDLDSFSTEGPELIAVGSVGEAKEYLAVKIVEGVPKRLASWNGRSEAEKLPEERGLSGNFSERVDVVSVAC